MQKELITIVLPIYNVEKYLDRSIKSLLNQSYKKLEIILVDDGSTDSCAFRCDEWAKRDKRIKVIHKINAGLGEARNTGIENANGEYICFFDSDDYVDSQIIEKAYRSITRNRANIVVWGTGEVSESGKIKYFIPKIPKKVYAGEEVQNVFLPELITPDPDTGKRTYLRMSAWACMFSMETILSVKWRFLSERQFISEDVISLLCLYKAVDKVAVIPECLYYYCKNDDSLTHVYKADRFKKINICYDACINVCKQSGYHQDVIDRLGFWYYSSVLSALKILVNSKSVRECITEINKTINDIHYNQVIQQLKFNREPVSRKLIYMAFKSKSSILIYIVLELRIILQKQKTCIENIFNRSRNEKNMYYHSI